MNASLRAAVAERLGEDVTAVRPVGGGSINEAYRCDLRSRTVFVKTNRGSDRTMFPAEARGLAWLAEPGVIRIPEVYATSEADGTGPQFIVMEYLDSAPRCADFDERLGRELAALHRSGPDRFGLDHDNFIGSLPQYNEPRETWAEFYRDKRLIPQLEMARERGLADADLERRFEQLLSRLDDLVGPPEPPARLHGDLWGGNLHTGPGGEPCLIDPAVSAGHREHDLGMMVLFGGFSARVFDAYHEAHPLHDGWRDRLGLYTLYFVMVHVNLFGSGYVGQAKSLLRQYT